MHQSVKQAIEVFNAKCEENLVQSNDLGKFYRFVNRKTTNYKAIPAIYGDDGKLSTDATEQANIFNKYFASVAYSLLIEH